MKKILSVVLAVAMVITLFAACSREKQSGELAGIVVFQSDFGDRKSVV